MYIYDVYLVELERLIQTSTVLFRRKKNDEKSPELVKKKRQNIFLQ